jgi:hypothetical protein
MAIKVRYNELIINQQNGSINSGVPRDWSRRIHSVNRVPRPNSPHCTYRHQIGNQINECPFIEDNVRQGFVEHFQNQNLELARVGNMDLLSKRICNKRKLKIQIDLENRSKDIIE